jgi:hypothetical protein
LANAVQTIGAKPLFQGALLEPKGLKYLPVIRFGGVSVLFVSRVYVCAQRDYLLVQFPAA